PWMGTGSVNVQDAFEGSPRESLLDPRMLPRQHAPGLADGRYPGSGSRTTPSRFPCAVVKNTFLEFETEDDDPWLLGGTADRQKTDSLLDRRAAGMLRRELAAHGSGVGSGPARSLRITGCRQKSSPRTRPSQGSGSRPLGCQACSPGTPCPAHRGASRGRAGARPRASSTPRQRAATGDGAADASPQQWQELSVCGEPSTGLSGGWFEDDGLSEHTGSTFFPSLEADQAQPAREAAETGGGLAEGSTTVVLRNIPGGHTERQILQDRPMSTCLDSA
ncbi:unnamed protein product, partial [Prorocentrum cordatum]